jgi:ubiquinone/menaquinone biosynthesis C-methylase UbiE
MCAYDCYAKAAHLYDIFDTKENIDLFLGYAAENGAILDVGAGTGRIAVPMAERGSRVWCVEPSRAMLREFRRKLAGMDTSVSGRITLIEGDAAGFRAGRAFPAAFMSGSFDHFLSEEERLKGLTNIARHLEPGGKLIFDVGLGHMTDSPLKPAGEKTVGETTFRRFVGRRIVPGRRLEYLLVFEVVEGGTIRERIEQQSFAGIVDRPTIHRVLEATGFTISNEFGGYRAEPYREGDGILVVEAVAM